MNLGFKMNSLQHQQSSLQLDQSWSGTGLFCSMDSDYRFEPIRAFFRDSTETV